MVLALSSTGKEFIEGENWIESVLSTIKPEYSKAQKIAIIDNAIGRRVSYSPDFDTEVFEYSGIIELYGKLLVQVMEYAMAFLESSSIC